MKPGDVYILKANRKPVIVVSREELNRGDYVVAVLLTTKRLAERKNLANCVLFDAGVAGLTKACVAQGESVSFISKDEIDTEAGPIGELSGEKHREVIRAIGHSIGADCEPQ